MSMRQHNFENQHTINDLISEYEAMSQKGTVGFFEKAAFHCILDYYERHGLIDQALSVVDHALGQHPYYGEFYLLKAQLLLDKGFETQALGCLEKAEAFTPNDIGIHLLRVDALISLSQYQDALLLLDNMKRGAVKSDLSEIYLREAIIHEHIEDYNEMFRSLRSSALANPENRETLERMWYCVEISENFSRSVQLHKKLVDINAYSSLAWYNLGLAQAGLENYEDAAEAFEYAFLIDEKFGFAYRDCAAALIQLNQYEKALECYEEYLEHFNPDCDLYTKIGQCYEFLDNYTLAKTFYIRAARINPMNDEVYYRMGECYVKERRWKSAITSYTKAVKLDNRKEEYIAALAEAYYQMNDPIKASYLFKKATETAPEQAKYWIQYSSFLMEVGEKEEALEVINEAIIYACGTELHYCRIVCLFALGRRQEALLSLKETLYKDFDMHDSLFDLSPELANDAEVLSVISAHLK